MVGSLLKSCGWVWEEGVSEERKPAAVFGINYAERNGICPLQTFMSMQRIDINLNWSV